MATITGFLKVSSPFIFFIYNVLCINCTLIRYRGPEASCFPDSLFALV